MPSHVTSMRRLAAVATFVLVAAQLIGLVHEARVRHVRCTEHGELVEAADLAPSASDATRLVAVGAGDASDVHCAIASTLRQHATEQQFLVPVVTAHELVAAQLLATPPIAATTLVFRIAPKTSPPAGPRTTQG